MNYQQTSLIDDLLKKKPLKKFLLDSNLPVLPGDWHYSIDDLLLVGIDRPQFQIPVLMPPSNGQSNYDLRYESINIQTYKIFESFSFDFKTNFQKWNFDNTDPEIIQHFEQKIIAFLKLKKEEINKSQRVFECFFIYKIFQVHDPELPTDTKDYCINLKCAHLDRERDKAEVRSEKISKLLEI